MPSDRRNGACVIELLLDRKLIGGVADLFALKKKKTNCLF
jgi:NAD-dependent DNA ligase